MNEDITQDDLLKALIEAMSSDTADGGRSFAEIQDATGWHTVKIRRGLKDLQKKGKLQVGRGQRINIAGISSPVPVYSVKQDNHPIERPAETPKLEVALASPPELPAQQ